MNNNTVQYCNIVRLDYVLAEKGLNTVTTFSLLYVPMVQEGYVKSICVGEYEVFAKEGTELPECTMEENNESDVDGYCERVGLEVEYFEVVIPQQ